MAEFDSIPVLAVAGPTASGKSALAVQLALRFGGEIISCDSMQVYRELTVATAQPTAAEMQGVPHYLIGFLPPDTPFSVADYCTLADERIRDVHARGCLPILCGGTGLYMQSLLENLDFSNDGADVELRRSLHDLARAQGNIAVWERLKAVDPFGAETLHPNNLGRVIRAIEIYTTTGRTLAQQREYSRRTPSPYRALTLCLSFRDRQVLYDRIDRRVERMVQDGLEAQARAFYAKYGADGGTARQAIGCKELLPYFRGECSFDDALDTVKRETRRYAKRQMTWFRRMQDVHFLYVDELPDLPEQASMLIKDFLATNECSFNDF